MRTTSTSTKFSFVETPPTRVTSPTTPLESELVLTQAPPVTHIAPIIPQPRIFNILKGDGVRTILEVKLLSIESLEGKHREILKTI